MKRVWVVEDKIPINELYSGPFPAKLDADMVRHLVDELDSEAWSEPEVLELCRALCAPEYEAAFFLSPDAMLRNMKDGAIAPHAVIFDWEYPGATDERNRAALQQLLDSSFAYVQVYTHLGGEGVEPLLVDLRQKYNGRLLPARGKGVVRAAELSSEIQKAWSGTIAGDVADKVREQVSGAVEHALIDFCEIGTGGIAAMVQGESDNIVNLVLSKVRDEIGTRGSETLDAIMSAPYTGESSQQVRRLMSIWYYYFPADKRVRRGDLIDVDGSLGLVLTPPCDLYSFSKKAGSRLTWLEVARMDPEGIANIRASGIRFDSVGNSIIAKHGNAGEAVVVLPNVPLATNSREVVADYAVLCHAWTNRKFEVPGGELTYDSLSGISRRCTLAEPFVSAIIARVTSVVSSPGTPDLPKGEVTRLGALTVPPPKPAGNAVSAKGAS
jgi:hypothetical protein